MAKSSGGKDSEKKKRVYETVKDGSATILGAAALVLTINLGIITFAGDSATAQEVLSSINIPVKISGILLIASLVSGGFALVYLYELIEEPGDEKGAVYSYRIQHWTFIAGLISMFVAVWIRLG